MVLAHYFFVFFVSVKSALMLYIKDEGRPFLFLLEKTINNLTAETISNTAVCNAHECVCV